jgi:hypothetical protein
MFSMGGFLGWKEPPPAAIRMDLQTNVLPASVFTRKRGASAVPRVSMASTISFRWKVGLNGSICRSRLSTSPWPVMIGNPGMS